MGVSSAAIDYVLASLFWLFLAMYAGSNPPIPNTM